jgi:hypothetical protein
MREEKKAKFPCDNCGQYGHWKYQLMCLNYSKHLEMMQQAAAAYRARQGGAAVANEERRWGRQWYRSQVFSTGYLLAMDYIGKLELRKLRINYRKILNRIWQGR